MKNAVINACFLVASTLAMFIGLEIFLRLFFGVPLTDPTNYAAERITPGWSRNWEVALKSLYHPVLGWTFPRDEKSNPHGLIARKRDALPAQPGQTVLVAGDSFGTGDDAEMNWPNQLEDVVKLPVINGSTGGWGIDQIYLRLESLVPVFRPGVLIFNFIPDAVQRAEVSVFLGAPKSYFSIQGDELVLMNSPPPRYEPSRAHVGWMRAIFGRSYVVYRTAVAFGLEDKWLSRNLELKREHKRGAEVGCLIMRKLRRLQSEYGIRRVVIFPEYPSTEVWDVKGDFLVNAEKLRRVVDCAHKEGLTVADPLQFFMSQGVTPEQRDRTLKKYWRYPFDPHMTAAGDRILAEFLAPYVLQ